MNFLRFFCASTLRLSEILLIVRGHQSKAEKLRGCFDFTVNFYASWRTRVSYIPTKQPQICGQNIASLACFSPFVSGWRDIICYKTQLLQIWSEILTFAMPHGNRLATQLPNETPQVHPVVVVSKPFWTVHPFCCKRIHMGWNYFVDLFLWSILLIFLGVKQCSCLILSHVFHSNKSSLSTGMWLGHVPVWGFAEPWDSSTCVASISNLQDQHPPKYRAPQTSD